MVDLPQSPSVHRHWIGAFALLLIIGVMRLAGESSVALLHVLLTDGVMSAVWAGACVGVGGCMLPHAALSRLGTGSRAWLVATRFGIGAGVISLAVLFAGLLGILSAPVAWGWVAIGVVLLGWGIVRSRRESRSGWFSFNVSPWMWAWLIAVPAATVLVVAPSVLPGVLWGDEPNGYDVVSYHLQIPREWYAAGRITRLDHNVFSNFPFLVEMHYLLAMHLRGGAYAGMYLSQYMHAWCTVFTVVAVYGWLGGRAKPQAVVGATVALAVPWTYMAGTVAYNEAALMLYATLSVGWMWRAIQPSEVILSRLARYAPAVISGVTAGFASGVKLTALPMVVGVTALSTVLLRMRAWLGVIVMLFAAGAAASPWLMRNLAWTGNPVFPQATALLGGSNWSASQQDRWKAAHSPRDDQRSMNGRLAALREQVLTDWKYGLALPPAAVVAMVWIGMRFRGIDRRFAIFLAINVGALVLIWLFATHLQGRFLVLAVPLLAVLTGAACVNRTGAALGLICAAICSISGVISFSAPALERDDPNQLLPQPVARLLDPRMRATIGLTDPQAFWAFAPESIVGGVSGSDRPIGLVGDAKAFWWPIDTHRLHYRTVFDVDRREGESLLDAWKRGYPAGAMIVIDPNELRRMTRTYRGLGDVPAEVAREPQSYLQANVRE